MILHASLFGLSLLGSLFPKCTCTLHSIPL
uniref:Uncharacterized protein n=1 Tax=Zea mays TaxID=4577 RepID=B4FD35_MAIZE|nr:unknown [Zea mays]